MKEKIITIKPKNITQKQWINLLLELNLMRKAWKPYGVDINIQAPQNWNRTKDEKYKKLWYDLIRKAGNELNYFDRRNISSSSSDRTDDGRYRVI
jgi:hypothetical protein